MPQRPERLRDPPLISSSLGLAQQLSRRLLFTVQVPGPSAHLGQRDRSHPGRRLAAGPFAQHKGLPALPLRRIEITRTEREQAREPSLLGSLDHLDQLVNRFAVPCLRRADEM